LRIKGFICSTNNDITVKKKETLEITCDTKMSGSADFEGPLFTTYEVKCPSGCRLSSAGILHGKYLYRD